MLITDVCVKRALSSQVRSIFGQCVITMAHHHYLELEGGHSLVEFVVKQSAINLEDKVSNGYIINDASWILKL